MLLKGEFPGQQCAQAGIQGAQEKAAPRGRSSMLWIPAGAGMADQEWNFTTSGTISSATMLMILISGLTAGPAVSL